ncbi:hypothetical protein AZE42_04903 [Rhizopogon vesiculosus]|uniref:Amino acid permease/ SLC12A domain-containing protein n=1 Tax=Rhizopogon vesiculosus TaxID=180088 RepID=A0A1J8R9C3_9AGAM|nr:hypothetical protein AZE42_04903 [Rhizopogon vesiculosus]
MAPRSLCSIGEMTSHAPVSGSFPHFAARWVDPALGFAVGWTSAYVDFFPSSFLCSSTASITVPAEISGAQILIMYWDSNVRRASPWFVAELMKSLYSRIMLVFTRRFSLFLLAQ